MGRRGIAQISFRICFIIFAGLILAASVGVLDFWNRQRGISATWFMLYRSYLSLAELERQASV